MDREQIRAVALDNACRLAAAGYLYVGDTDIRTQASILEAAGRFEAWLTRGTGTGTDTAEDTGIVACSGCEHAPHTGRCPQFLKGPFGPWRCACDLDTPADTVTACGWNPGTPGPNCDWDRACPEHGASAAAMGVPAPSTGTDTGTVTSTDTGTVTSTSTSTSTDTSTDTGTDTILSDWDMCPCGHAGAWHSNDAYGCQGVHGHRPCGCLKSGTLVAFGKLPEIPDTGTRAGGN